VTDTLTGFVDKPSMCRYSRDGGSPLRRPGGGCWLMNEGGVGKAPLVVRSRARVPKDVGRCKREGGAELMKVRKATQR
jgi:hypothetical protein